MSNLNELVDISTVVDLYVQRVSLEATQVVASLKIEVMVMHTVNGYSDEGWDNAVTSAQKIVEFIDLFCKKSQQKISTVALVVIDKLQGAHNKLLEAARIKHSQSAKQVALTSAKLLQQSAKIFTYALIAERSGHAIFRAMHIQAGENLALAASQQHSKFDSAVIDEHLIYARIMSVKSAEQNALNNNRKSKICDTAAQYCQALAAIAVNNFDNDANPSSALVFRSTRLNQVYILFQYQLVALMEYIEGDMLWQAEVLVIDLQTNTNLLDPSIFICSDVLNIFAISNALVESVVYISPDQDVFLSQNAKSVPALTVVQMLQMGRMHLSQYVKLLQEQEYCNGLIVESQTHMYANGPRFSSFYRRLWKHVHQLVMCHEAATSEAINLFFNVSKSQSETEWKAWIVQSERLKDWICVTVTLEDAHTCLDYYTHQLRNLRPDRPAKVVEVITRAWRSAQSILQQLLIDLEAQVLQKDEFVLVVSTVDIQGAHNTARSRALAFAQIAQELYQNTSGFYTECRITERMGEQLCTEALTSVMEQFAVFAGEYLIYLDKIAEATDTAPNRENVITEALDALKQIVNSRRKAEINTLNESLAHLWHAIYRIQIKYVASGFQKYSSAFLGHVPILEQLLKRMTEADAHCSSKTVEYLLLASEYFVRSQRTRLDEWLAFSRISGSYTLAAQALLCLSEMTSNNFQTEEDASITLARMRVDRHYCNALCYVEMMNNPRKEPPDLEHGRDELFIEHCRDGYLIGRSQKMLSNDYRECEGGDCKVISVMVWENKFIKDFFTNRLPQSAHVFDPLRDYGYEVSEQHRDQMDKLVINFQEEFTCQYTFLHVKRDKSKESESWWRRAETAASLVRKCIYTFCFDGLPLESITQSNIVYVAIKQCAVAMDENKSLHASCTEVAKLALSNLRPSDRNVDCAERTQRDILSNYCARFLAAAATEDTAQIELALVAVDNQKQVLQDLRAQLRERMFSEY